jgi:hypothetical protein
MIARSNHPFYFPYIRNLVVKKLRVYHCWSPTSHQRGSLVRRSFCVFLLFAALSLCGSAAHTRNHSSYGVKSSRSSKNSRPGYVRGYVRKDGTYVPPHIRGLAGGDYHARRSSHPAYRSTRYIGLSSRTVTGRTERSTAAKDSFKRQQPCPSTGRSSGACSGYVIDHVRPLECGGADSPSNMQWQTIADGKAKDKTERYCR